MITKPKEFNTTDDIINYLIENPSRSEMKWKVLTYHSMEWKDPEAGNAWTEEYNAMQDNLPPGPDGSKRFLWSWDTELTEEERNQLSQLVQRMPAKHEVTHYRLEHSEATMYRPIVINLSDELGALIDSFWTKRSQAMTLPSILKRLGLDSGLSEKLKESQEKIEATQKKDLRNAQRARIRNLYAELLLEVEKARNLGLTLEFSLTNPENLEDE